MNHSDIGENAPKQIRGRCIGCMQLFNVTGICVSFFVNYGMNQHVKDPLSPVKWRVPFALQMLPGFLLLIGIVFQNESPRWLVEKNRTDDAAKALARVRGKSIESVEVIEELNDIVADFNGHEKLPLIAQVKAACSGKRMLYRSSFVVILMFFQQWTGTNSIVSYGPRRINVLFLIHILIELLCSTNLQVYRPYRKFYRSLRDWCLRYCKDFDDRDWLDGFHRTTRTQVVSTYRLSWTSFRHVLHWRQHGTSSTKRTARWQLHLRHRLCLLVRGILLIR